MTLSLTPIDISINLIFFLMDGFPDPNLFPGPHGYSSPTHGTSTAPEIRRDES